MRCSHGVIPGGPLALLLTDDMSPAGAAVASAVLLAGVGGAGRANPAPSVERPLGVLMAEAPPPPKAFPLMSAIEGVCADTGTAGVGKGVEGCMGDTGRNRMVSSLTLPLGPQHRFDTQLRMGAAS